MLAAVEGEIEAIKEKLEPLGSFRESWLEEAEHEGEGRRRPRGYRGVR